MEELLIGLDSWIIQDGNYSDFFVGQTVSFALEFYAHEPLAVAAATAPQLTHIHDGKYRATGQVVYVHSDEWLVIDFGVMAYRQGHTADGLQVGDWVQGDVSFGIDPFFYFEELVDLPGAPALSYGWSIDGIHIESAPMIEVAPRRLERDARKLGRKSVEGTNAWTDDRGHGDYLLQCRLLPDAPTRGRRGSV